MTTFNYTAAESHSPSVSMWEAPDPLTAFEVIPDEGYLIMHDNYGSPGDSDLLIITMPTATQHMSDWIAVGRKDQLAFLFKVRKAKLVAVSSDFAEVCRTPKPPPAAGLGVLGRLQLPYVELEEQADVVKAILDTYLSTRKSTSSLRRMSWSRLSLLWGVTGKYHLPLLRQHTTDILITTVDSSQLSDAVATLAQASAPMSPDDEDDADDDPALCDLRDALTSRIAKEPVSKASCELLSRLSAASFLRVCAMRDTMILKGFKALLEECQKEGYPTTFRKSDASLEKVAKLLSCDTSVYKYDAVPAPVDSKATSSRVSIASPDKCSGWSTW